MIGDRETFELTTDDDNLHEPTSDHPWWTETFWLSFALPERRMHVCIYPWFRKNLGLQAGGVRIPVDTVARRDRSWSVRLGAARVGYAWGTTASDTSFLAVTIMVDGAEKVCDGYLLQDGEAARLEDGARRTTRAAGRPDKLSIDASDALGRTLHAE